MTVPAHQAFPNRARFFVPGGVKTPGAATYYRHGRGCFFSLPCPQLCAFLPRVENDTSFSVRFYRRMGSRPRAASHCVTASTGPGATATTSNGGQIELPCRWCASGRSHALKTRDRYACLCNAAAGSEPAIFRLSTLTLLRV